MSQYRRDLVLSVLEAVPVGPGVQPHQAFRWARNVAKMADSANFKRLWVVEHHSMPDIGSSAPTVLLGHLAALTSRIRLGSGGVMLPNHAPMIVAEQFATLEAIDPGRFDLGVGASIGGNSKLSEALRRPRSAEFGFEAQIDELCDYLASGDPTGTSRAMLPVTPSVFPPPVFLLGASVGMAQLAAKKGMGFAYAGHLKPDGATEAVDAYRTAFKPTPRSAKPYVILTRTAIAAETTQHAKTVATAVAIQRIRAATSARSGLNVGPDVLLYPEFSAAEREIARKELSGDWISVGSGDDVIADFEDTQQRVDADEIMITSIEFDGDDRVRTLQTIAAAQKVNADKQGSRHAYA